MAGAGAAATTGVEAVTGGTPLHSGTLLYCQDQSTVTASFWPSSQWLPNPSRDLKQAK